MKVGSLKKRVWPWAEYALWAFALLGCLCLGAEWVDRSVAQRHANAVAPGNRTLVQASRGTASKANASARPVLGRLEVPALRLSVPILDSDDPLSLEKGVGHLKDTATPGGLGNFVLAGHRDSFFRPLENVKQGMALHVVTEEGRYDYIVDSTSVVLPTDTDDLGIGQRPEMTLITCYPFHFVGAAPKRFLVHAHLVSVAASS